MSTDLYLQWGGGPMLPRACDYGKYTGRLRGSLKTASSSPASTCLSYWTLGGEAKPAPAPAAGSQGNGAQGGSQDIAKYVV